MTYIIAITISMITFLVYLLHTIKKYSLDIEKKKQYISNLESKVTIYENVKNEINNIKKTDKTNASTVLDKLHDNKL